MAYLSEIRQIITNDDAEFPDNCLSEMQLRGHGLHICKEATLGGTGAQIVNALQLTGSVVVINQWAIITEVTTLTNLTNVYATLYDGTNEVYLTADGMTLSGAPVGTFFTKDLIATQPYTVNIADQCRMMENTTSKYAGKPFVITQKNGTNTYVRFHYTTSDNPVSFKLKIHFEYIPMNGSTLVFL